ncbi:uncharacterized protein LOC124344698 [Daphnia pulicaria]|uniref:uncharacterized protein LOC124344698 n=1 Tax=Daphnia pulicaria TaxID=35523 RepID=UPI001EEABB18|nr:uncharacterized protein LOC124344698 [Daphnia pulicaria]
MKKTVINPTFGCGDYQFKDLYSSTLKSMHEKCTSMLRPTWTKTDVISQVDYQQFFKQQSDLEITMLEENYFQHGSHRDDAEVTLNFALTPPRLDPNLNTEFTDNWDFNPEILSTKDLQIAKCEPFSGLICEESFPVNTLYEEAKNIACQPLQFDDPLKMNPSRLLPAISNENFPPQVCLSLANLKLNLKEISYPETPSCDYLLELASQVQDLNIVSDGEAKGSVLDNPGGGINLEVINSDEHATESDQTSINIERITLELPGFAVNSVHLMEEHLSTCLQILKDSNSPLIEDLLKESHSVIEPTTTRHYLLKLQEAIAKNNSDPGGKTNHGRILKNILPALLSLHGVNKSLEIFLNIDYDIAYGTLANFEKTHEAVLKSDYKTLILQLLRLRPKRFDECHPKLVKLKELVLHQLSEDGNSKIWIRLYRHSNIIAERIERLLASVDVQCQVDPQIECPESEGSFLPSGNYPVFVAEQVSKSFPPSMLSLIIHYEWLSTVEMDRQFAQITQKAIEISRPVRLGDAENIPDQQTCPVSMSSTGHLLDSSPFKEPEVDDSDDSDGSEIFIEQQVESTANKEPLINSQDELLLHIHDVIPIEPPGESCFVSQLSDEESQEEEDFSKSPIITNEIDRISVADIEDDNSGSIEPLLPLVLSSHLATNAELMEAIEADDNSGIFIIHECDYEFLGYISKYQPDVLLSANTALLIVHEQEKFEETRLRILTASFKCTKCWVIILAPGVISSSKPPVQWHSLAGLARFYEKKDRKKTETRFLLKPRIALNYHQVAFIIKDVALDEINQDIESHLQPLSTEAKRLLHIPQLNAVTAPLIAQHFDAKELVTLPVETLCNRIPTLRQTIKMLRYCHEMNNEEQESQVEDMEANSSFGHLKHAQPWDLETESLEECGSRQLPTPKKRAKLDSDHPEEMGTPLSVSQLRDMWCSPSPNQPV